MLFSIAEKKEISQNDLNIRTGLKKKIVKTAEAKVSKAPNKTVVIKSNHLVTKPEKISAVDFGERHPEVCENNICMQSYAHTHFDCIKLFQSTSVENDTIMNIIGIYFYLSTSSIYILGIYYTNMLQHIFISYKLGLLI